MSANSPLVQSELRAAIRSYRLAFFSIAVMSGMVNVLYLTGSFFMLQVYDRVLPSRSFATLISLAILAALLYTFQGVLDLVRNRILVRIGVSLDQSLSTRIYELIVRMPLVGREAEGMRPLRDIDQVRGFLSSTGPVALLDLPWLPLYLGICFAFHPLIGFVATFGGFLLLSITLITERLIRAPVAAGVGFGGQRNLLADAARRNAEVVKVMGIAGRLAAIWADANSNYMAQQQKVSDITGGLGGLAKTLRMVLQSAVLATGAYLVITEETTAGIIIASSILTSRALAPIELLTANWKGFVAARQSWRRLDILFQSMPAERTRTALPAPLTVLTVEGLAVIAPGSSQLVVQGASFELCAGSALGVVGPSASGKSSLMRALVGAWQPSRGSVRLDGAVLENWDQDELGRHIGYLPQDVELFAGTVAQNIARFQPSFSADTVIAAARAAGIHEMILRFPDGYDAQIGESGHLLSAGQRQRIGLARALYGDPFLVVLDEPNSHLDTDGEAALTRAIRVIRARRAIAVIVAHRPSVLNAVDLAMVVVGGRVQSFGPRDEVLSKLAKRNRQPPPPLKIVEEPQVIQS